MDEIPALKSIDHVHVHVASRNDAVKWYRDVLGLVPAAELEFWAKDGGPLTLVDPSGNVHIALFESPKHDCRSTIALNVGAAEFMSWKRHLGNKLHGPIEAEDHEVSWSLYFSDPDGNPYEITTYEYVSVTQLLAGA